MTKAPESKTCIACKETQATTGPRCKACHRLHVNALRAKPEAKERATQYRLANLEQHREHNRAYRKRNPGKETIKTAKWRADNPKRNRAHRTLWDAIVRGAVKKLPCFVCGDTGQAHHPDYDRPLDVVWLCKMHHAAAHKLAIAAAIRQDGQGKGE